MAQRRMEKAGRKPPTHFTKAKVRLTGCWFSASIGSFAPQIIGFFKTWHIYLLTLRTSFCSVVISDTQSGGGSVYVLVPTHFALKHAQAHNPTVQQRQWSFYLHDLLVIVSSSYPPQVVNQRHSPQAAELQYTGTSEVYHRSDQHLPAWNSSYASCH